MELAYKYFKTAIINMLNNVKKNIHIMRRDQISKNELNRTSRAEKYNTWNEMFTG